MGTSCSGLVLLTRWPHEAAVTQFRPSQMFSVNRHIALKLQRFVRVVSADPHRLASAEAVHSDSAHAASTRHAAAQADWAGSNSGPRSMASSSCTMSEKVGRAAGSELRQWRPRPCSSSSFTAARMGRTGKQSHCSQGGAASCLPVHIASMKRCNTISTLLALPLTKQPWHGLNLLSKP